MEFKCPVCGKVIPSFNRDKEGKAKLTSKFFPFCSERCKLIDMGAWFDEDYTLPAEDDDSGTEPPQENH